MKKIRKNHRYVVFSLAGGLLISGLAFVVMGKNFGFENVRITALIPGFFVGATATAVITYLIIRSRAKLLEHLITERRISSELKAEIAQRKLIQNALKENEERFSLAMRGANDGLWDWDLKTGDVYYSPRWCEMLGYRQDEVSPSLEGWGNLVDPGDKDRVLGLVDDYLAGRSDAFEAEFRMQHKDGAWVEIWARAFLVKHGDEPTRLVGTHVDISLRKQLEDQIRQAHKMEAVGQLTGGVAHDFNNLLSIMLGNAEEVRDLVGDNEKALRHIDSTIAAINRSAALTQRLLSFARQQVLRPAAADVGALVGGFSDMLRSTLGETVSLHVTTHGDLWPATVDANQFENALLNLALNARDAMPRGGTLTITCENVTLNESYVSAHDDLTSGDYVKVSVRDTGSGIAAEDLDNAFEPFFTTKEVGEGSGLGLSMVYGFAKQSKGHITIDSEVGRGTTVALYLPRSQEMVAQDETPSVASAISGPRSERILIVEDDPDLREISVTLFRNLGFEVVEARNGAEALTHLNNGKPFHLLFSDMVLPGGMNGVEIAQAARQKQPDIQVLFTTGYTQSGIFENSSAGINECVVGKPYSRGELLAKVTGLLDGSVN